MSMKANSVPVGHVAAANIGREPGAKLLADALLAPIKETDARPGFSSSPGLSDSYFNNGSHGTQ